MKMPQSNDIRDKLINEVRFLLHKGDERNHIVMQLVPQGFNPLFINEVIDYVSAQDKIAVQPQSQPQPQLKSQSQSSSQSSPPQSFSQSQSPSQSQPQQSDSNPVQGISQNGNVMKVEHTHSLSLGTLMFMLMFFIVLLSVSSIMFFTQNNGEEFLLDYEIQLNKGQFNAGSNVEFQSRYTNRGTNNQFDIFINYIIYNAKQENVMEWEKTYAISNVQNDYITQVIPKDIPSGKYYLFSEITYGNDQKATARSLYFDIINEFIVNQTEVNDSTEITIPPINNTEDNVNDSDDGPDEPDEPIPPEPEPVEPISEPDDDDSDEPLDSDDNINDDHPSDDIVDAVQQELDEQEYILEKIEEAKYYALSSNPEDYITAAEICKNFTEAKLVDNCFQQLSKTTNNYWYCAEIGDVAARDFCYISYVIDMNNYEMCNEIVSEKTKKSCYILNPDYSGE